MKFLVFVHLFNCHFFKKLIYVGGCWRSIYTKTYPLFLRDCKYETDAYAIFWFIFFNLREIKLLPTNQVRPPPYLTPSLLALISNSLR